MFYMRKKRKKTMRIDKFLKVSRLIKRRTLAKQFLDHGYVKVNDKIVKPSANVDVGDIITFNEKSFRIVKILEHATEEVAASMYKEI